MQTIEVTIAGERFQAHFRDDVAPVTCASFQAMLPFQRKLIHAQWSGEACWVPLGNASLDLGEENATSSPDPGDILLYPGGTSETEILLAYGTVRFAAESGRLAGNPLLRITDKLDRLAEIGRAILWNGARDIIFGRNRSSAGHTDSVNEGSSACASSR